MKNYIPETAYFHGDEIYQFIHLQVPYDLVVDDVFSDISGDAKLLYGLLLNRTSLSIRNGWEDEKGRTYINYKLEDVQKDLHIGHTKASKLFSELSKIKKVDTEDGEFYIGLIKKVKVLNGCSRIYVYKVSEIKNLLENNSISADIRKCGLRTTADADDGHPQTRMTDNRECEPQTSVDTVENNNINNIYNNSSNIQSINPDNDNGDRLIEKPDALDDEYIKKHKYELTTELLKENINYNTLTMIQQGKYKDQTDEILSIMVEACLYENVIKINNQVIPRNQAESRMMKLDFLMVKNVMDKIENNYRNIKNPKGYVAALLYNESLTYKTNQNLKN